MAKVTVHGIEWDADDKKDVAHLPTTVILNVPPDVDVNDEDDLLDFIENELSDAYGFTHNGWDGDTID